MLKNFIQRFYQILASDALSLSNCLLLLQNKLYSQFGGSFLSNFIGKVIENRWLPCLLGDEHISSLKILLFNAQNIVNLQKRLSLVELLSQKCPASVCLVETWLDDSTSDSMIFCGLPYSVIIRCDRKEGKHGGLLMAAHGSFLQMFELLEAKIDDFCLSCMFSNSTSNFAVILLYLPPRGSKYFIPTSTAGSCIVKRFNEIKLAAATSPKDLSVI